MVNKEQLIEDAELIKTALTDTIKKDVIITKESTEIEVVAELVNKLVKDNSRLSQNQDEYQKKYDGLVLRYNEIKKALECALKDKEYKIGKAKRLDGLIETIKSSDSFLEEWQEREWNILLEKVMVHQDKTIIFIFKNGTEIIV